MDTKKKDILTGLIVGAVIFILVIVLNPQEEYGSWILRICDGFFVASVFVLGFGGLVWCRNKGAFDMIAFGLATAFHIHYPASKSIDAEKEDFYAYRERKANSRKPAKGLIIAGAIYLALATIMLIIYYI